MSNKFEEAFDRAARVLYRPPIDWTEYRRLVEVAHEAGDPRATYAMATWHLHGEGDVGIVRQPKRALPLLTAAAAHFSLAALDLAFAHETGRLVGRRDAKTALRLYRRAARLGSVQARYDVGRCYWWGIGVPKNRTIASRHLREAARLGYVESVEPVNTPGKRDLRQPPPRRR